MSINNLLGNARSVRWRSNARALTLLAALTRDESLAMQADDIVSARLPLYSASCSATGFWEAGHMLIGADHAWDMARRIRSSLCQHSSAEKYSEELY